MYTVSEERMLKGWTRLFSVVPSNSTRDNEQKLMHRKFPLNMKKNLTMWVTALEQIAREAVYSLSLDIFKHHLDSIPCNVPQDDPIWATRWDQMTHWGHFQPYSLIFWFSCSTFMNCHMGDLPPWSFLLQKSDGQYKNVLSFERRAVLSKATPWIDYEIALRAFWEMSENQFWIQVCWI